MSARAHLVAVESQAFAELLRVLAEALGGKRRTLARWATRAGMDATGAVAELGAFPASACAALDEVAGLRPAACIAGRGCPVEDECPLVRGEQPARIESSALASLVRASLDEISRGLPACPRRGGLAALRAPVEALLAASGALDESRPPRARTSLVLLDHAVDRGGPLGAVEAFLTGAEVEQFAAFVPPGSGRGDPELGAVEAWLRRVAVEDVALVEARSAR